jgi:hypothetical protein
MARTRGTTARYRYRDDRDPDDGRPIANLGYLAKSMVAAWPRAAVAVARVRRPNHALHRDTDVVIEGYPKSANGFVSHAFKEAQPGPIRIAHTTHAVGQVIAGCRLGIPALVLIRVPIGSVSRIALVRPEISLEQLLRGWIRFYRPLVPYRGRFALGRFEEVTSDLGAVMSRMNDQLGTRFVPFEHTPENQRSAFQALEDDWATRVDRDSPEFEVVSGRPSPMRDELTANLEAKLAAPRYGELLRRAEELYDTIATG